MLSSPFIPQFSITFSSSSAPHRTTTFRQTLIISNSAATAYKERPPSSVYLNPERMATCTSTLYEVLGIPIGASNKEIKSAYRRLARTCHPDVAALDRKNKSANEFMKIHDAYSTLSDPQKRAVYDLKFVRKNRPLTVSYSGGYRGRNWETDQCW